MLFYQVFPCLVALQNTNQKVNCDTVQLLFLTTWRQQKQAVSCLFTQFSFRGAALSFVGFESCVTGHLASVCVQYSLQLPCLQNRANFLTVTEDCMLLGVGVIAVAAFILNEKKWQQVKH